MSKEEQIKNLQNTIKTYDPAIANNKANSDVYYTKATHCEELATLTVDKSYYSQALESYNKAILLAPENQLYLIGRSKLHAQLGNKDLARADIETVQKCKTDSDSILAGYLPGAIQEVLGILGDSDLIFAD